MGSTYAAGLVDATDEGLCSLDNALAIHLQSNHYPPLPVCLVPVCVKAIQNIEDEEPEALVDMPTGMLLRVGNGFSDKPPSWRITEACHLDAFIQQLEE